jgi:phospholipase C
MMRNGSNVSTMRSRFHPTVLLSLALSLTIAACSSNSAGVVPNASDRAGDIAYVNAATTLPVGKYIKHVVIIVQENRTFDNIFGGYPGSDSKKIGDEVPELSNPREPNSAPQLIKLQTTTFVAEKQDLPHGWAPAIVDWNQGKMDGFNFYPAASPSDAPGNLAYAILVKSQVGPYWQMANQYVLLDHMFPTMFGGSFTGHLDLIASTANLTASTVPTPLSLVDFPEPVGPDNAWGCDAPYRTKTNTITADWKESLGTGPFPCLDQFNTIADRLDQANVSWKFYSAGYNNRGSGGPWWTTFDAIKRIACTNYVATTPPASITCARGKDWPRLVSPETTILQDAQKNNLASVSWVMPDYANSDHPATGSGTGPSWVASVVNAIGTSPYWNSTAIFIVWDDWGGWYDNVVPPKEGDWGLGIRVPGIIISPYVKHHVSKNVYEFGSILKFVEQAFNLGPISDGRPNMGYSDQRALSPATDFDFTQAPRKFHTIQAQYSAAYFLRQPASNEPPDTE